MVDTSQILIAAAITVMTVVLTVVGIQLILTLKDIRKLIVRVDTILAQIERAGFNITHGYGEILGFITGIKKLLSAVDHVSKKASTKKHAKK